MRKRAFLLALALLVPESVFPSIPRQLKTFDELMAALMSGQAVRAVLHYAKCRLVVEGKDEQAPDAVGGLEFRTWEHFAAGTVRNAKAYVSTSENVFVNHPRYGAITNYAKLRIYEDARVEILVQYFDRTTLKVVMEETFSGSVNDGTNGAGVFLYAGD